MSDLVRREDVLKLLRKREVVCRRNQAVLPKDSTAMTRKIRANLGATAAAFALAAGLIDRIPARTCATCAEWDALGWTPERGMCTADVYRSESTLITPPSHSCAAWRDPVAAITEHPIMRDNREALRMLRERDGG